MTTKLIAELQYNTELVVADATTYQLRATRYGLPDSVYIKVANKHYSNCKDVEPLPRNLLLKRMSGNDRWWLEQHEISEGISTIT